VPVGQPWLGFENWQLFGAIGLHSLPSVNINRIRSEWLPEIPAGQRPRLYLDIGENDPYFKYALAFENFLNDAKLRHEWHLNAGAHDETYWSAHVEDYLRWYAAGW